MNITITTHPLSGSTPNLTMETMTVTEQMSELFTIEANVITASQTLDAKQLLGTPIDIEVTFDTQSPRILNGVIRRISAGVEALIPGTTSNGRRYRFEIVPKLWFLTQSTNSRIFQNETIATTLTNLFREIGFENVQGAPDAFTFSLNVPENRTKQHEFIVQHSESDFNFISRTLEHHGIYYFFKHEKVGQQFVHHLTIGDHLTPYVALNPADINTDLGGSTLGEVTAWDHDYEFFADSFVGQDFNYLNPASVLTGNASETVDIAGNNGIEIYEYPAGFNNANDGNRLAGVRIDTEENRFSVVKGESRCSHFFPGATFNLADHPITEENGGYLLTEVVHHFINDDLVQSGEHNYKNNFECIPSNRLFHPPRKTPKPVVQGPQTAKVVGPDQQALHVDDHGRVKVQFHWDRRPSNQVSGESRSAFLRVSQSTAGNGRGNIFIPRVDDEVIVSFLEGDPDKPIITGSVYNETNKVPFRDGSSIRANRNGLKDVFGNEIYMDSTPGDEHIKLFSPSHNSGLSLGKDKVSWTSGDQKSYLWGCKFSFTHGAETTLNTGNLAKFTFGASETVFVGANIGGTIGAKVEPVIGTNVKMIMGQNYEIEWGIKRKFNWAHEYKKTEGNYIQAAKDKIVFDSEGEARLIGGDRDNSILTARKEGIFISHGKGQAGVNAIPEIAGNATKATVAAAVAVVSVGALGTSAGALGLLGEFENNNSSPTNASKDAAIGGVIGAGITTIASFAVALYLQKQIDKQFKDAKDTEDARFAGPANRQRSGNNDLQTDGLYSSVELNKQGLRLTAVKGPNGDQGDGDISLSAANHMFLGATQNLHLISSELRAEAQKIELKSRDSLEVETPQFLVNGNLLVEPDADPGIELEALDRMQENLEEEEPVVGWWEWLTTWN